MSKASFPSSSSAVAPRADSLSTPKARKSDRSLTWRNPGDLFRMRESGRSTSSRTESSSSSGVLEATSSRDTRCFAVVERPERRTHTRGGHAVHPSLAFGCGECPPFRRSGQDWKEMGSADACVLLRRTRFQRTTSPIGQQRRRKGRFLLLLDS